MKKLITTLILLCLTTVVGQTFTQRLIFKNVPTLNTLTSSSNPFTVVVLDKYNNVVQVPLSAIAPPITIPSLQAVCTTNSVLDVNQSITFNGLYSNNIELKNIYDGALGGTLVFRKTNNDRVVLSPTQLFLYYNNGYNYTTLDKDGIYTNQNNNLKGLLFPTYSSTRKYAVTSVNTMNADSQGNVTLIEASISNPGIVNNINLQELGGVDKTINGVTVGKGYGNIISNTAIGSQVLKGTTGYTPGGFNTGVGYNALLNNTTATGNTAVGYNSLSLNVDGINNTSIGAYALSKNIAGYSTAIGWKALGELTTGSALGIGFQAGTYNVAGSTNYYSQNSIFIGNNTKCDNSTSTQSEIVIGNGAASKGTRTTVIGTATTLKTYLFGQLNIGTIPTFADNAAAIAGFLIVGDVYKTSTGILMVRY